MKTSVSIFLLALVFLTAETAYFGWNFAPSCPGEVVCDGIACCLIGLSLVASAIEKGGRK